MLQPSVVSSSSSLASRSLRPSDPAGLRAINTRHSAGGPSICLLARPPPVLASSTAVAAPLHASGRRLLCCCCCCSTSVLPVRAVPALPVPRPPRCRSLVAGLAPPYRTHVCSRLLMFI